MNKYYLFIDTKYYYLEQLIGMKKIGLNLPKKPYPYPSENGYFLTFDSLKSLVEHVSKYCSIKTGTIIEICSNLDYLSMNNEAHFKSSKFKISKVITEKYISLL